MDWIRWWIDRLLLPATSASSGTRGPRTHGPLSYRVGRRCEKLSYKNSIPPERKNIKKTIFHHHGNSGAVHRYQKLLVTWIQWFLLFNMYLLKTKVSLKWSPNLFLHTFACVKCDTSICCCLMLYRDSTNVKDILIRAHKECNNTLY